MNVAIFKRKRMTENLRDILSHLSPDIDEETLLLYLQNKLSTEKKHEVEKKLLENDFAGDAAEGLQNINDQQRISYLVETLNRDLKKRLEKNKRRRQKMKITQQPWIFVTIIIILLLIVIAYVVIYFLLKSNS